MRLYRVLFVTVVLAIGAASCTPRSSVAPGGSRGESAKPVAVESPDAAQASEAPLAKVERLMAGFGMRFARSPQDDRLTAVVMEHLKKAHKVLPPNYRFAISKRRDGWAVDAFDVDALLNGKRQRGIGAYHIEDMDGRLRLLYIEADI
jgi:hypothetical protein